MHDPPRLCQTAVNLWSRLGRPADRLQVLDELPKAPTVEDPGAAKTVRGEYEEFTRLARDQAGPKYLKIRTVLLQYVSFFLD